MFHCLVGFLKAFSLLQPPVSTATLSSGPSNKPVPPDKDLFYLYVCVSMCLCVCTHVLAPVEAREGIKPPAAGVTGH